jgi:tetratricopeptide (TPR) repeat protein
VKAGKTSQAILKLRDGVDIAPFDLERRKSLILLLGDSSAENAALEARRAAAVMPEKVELRVLAARFWIKAGRTDEAQKDLNEAIARDPNGAATRLMLGEVSLNQLEPSKALPHLDEAIKQKDEAESRFLRAVCRALLGGTDGMLLDLAQVAKMDPSKTDSIVQKRYSFAVGLIDRTLTIDGTDLKTLIPKLIVKPKDPALHDDLDQMLRLVQSRTAFLTAIEPPAKLRVPHDQRLLAYRLLAQSILDVQTYCTTKDEDTLADARINLGESLKQIAAAKGGASTAPEKK